MGDTSRKLDFKELTSYGDSLIEILKDDKDIVGLKHFLHQSGALRSQCDQDFNRVQKSIQEYSKKIDECKKKTAAAESESVAEAELSSLQEELEREQQLERILREELRATVNEISKLEREAASIEEQSQTIKKIEQDETRAQMKLSMYASVSNIIPYLEDESKITGHIVERDKKAVEKFEFDPSEISTFNACNNIWKIIKS